MFLGDIVGQVKTSSCMSTVYPESNSMFITSFELFRPLEPEVLIRCLLR